MSAGGSISEELRAGTVLADRYRLLRPIGQGAAGAVFLAEHVHMRKRYAVKVLHPHAATPEVVWRFRAEAIAAANINHPGIAAAIDFGVLDGGALFLVLEFVDGESLAKVLERGPLPVAHALTIARDILSALDAAHRNGIVHRDVKPANVMIVGGDAFGSTVKLLDFGVAKTGFIDLRSGVTTGAGVIYGTAAYMAPEQARGETIDGRADLYAVGTVLYEMISGRTPFEGSALELLAAQVATEPPPLDAPVTRELTREVRELVARLLEKDAAARPRDAARAIAEIDEALRSLDTRVVVRPLAVKNKKMTVPPRSRRRAQLLCAAAAVVVVLCGAAGARTGREQRAVIGELLRDKPRESTPAVSPKQTSKTPPVAAPRAKLRPIAK